jgi:hypothetical protein
MVHDNTEIVPERLDGVDHDLGFVQGLVELPPALDPLPPQLVPARDFSPSTVDSASMNFDVGAHALDDCKACAVLVCQLSSLLSRLLAGDQIQDAIPTASQLLLRDAR